MNTNRICGLIKHLVLCAVFCMGVFPCSLLAEPSRPPEGIPVKDRDWMLTKLPDGLADASEIWTTGFEILEFHSAEEPDESDPPDVVWRLKIHTCFFLVTEAKIQLGAPLKELVGPGLGKDPGEFFVEAATYIVKHGNDAWAAELLLDKEGEFVTFSPLQVIHSIGQTLYKYDGREHVRFYRANGKAMFKAIVEATGKDPRMFECEADSDRKPKRPGSPQPTSGQGSSPSSGEAPNNGD